MADPTELDLNRWQRGFWAPGFTPDLNGDSFFDGIESVVNIPDVPLRGGRVLAEHTICANCGTELVGLLDAQGLRALRLSKGWVLREVGERTGLSVQYISDIEHDRRQSIKSRRLIQDALTKGASHA